MTRVAERFCAVIAFTVSLYASPALAQTTSDTIRVCTYNLLNFGGDDIDRVNPLRSILNEIDPHILIVQELSTVEGDFSGLRLFTDSVAGQLDIPLVEYAEYYPGEDSYNGIYLDTTHLDFLAIDAVGGDPRSHLVVVVRVRATGDTLAVIGGHWKAGSSSEDEDQRRSNATVVNLIINGLSQDSPFFEGKTENVVFAGDLNVYTSDEPGYQSLVTSGPFGGGRLRDPINRPGDWNNDIAFADIHTQSPRARQFGGGAHGGLDDRFDQILVTEALLDEVRPASYTAFGNDGAHFNDSLTAGVNAVVSVEIAQALHDVSDHLPVFVDFVFQKVSGVEEIEIPDELDLSDADETQPAASASRNLSGASVDAAGATDFPGATSGPTDAP